MDFTKLYINGEWITPDTKDLIEVENPANKEIFERVPRSNEKDVLLAIESAKEAFETWQYTELDERLNLMTKFVDILNNNLDTMAKVIVKELGTVYNTALNGHLIGYIKDIENYIGIARNYEYEEEFDGYIVRREPYGVVGALTPWNYPFGQITKKVVPALLAGNTVVLKPSQATPLIAYYFAQAIHDAGFPKGVFNLVTGRGSEVGNLIAKHEDVEVISFTGSTSGGIEVGKIAMETVKKSILELGGKSASILLEDADIDLALEVVLNTVYSNVGQTCSALTRMFAPRSLKEELERKLIEKTGEYKFGDPGDEENNVGVLTSQAQFDKVGSFIQKGIDAGANLLIGELPTDGSKGYYIDPVVFTEVENTMEIAQKEIFGPVLSVIYYEDVEEAIKMANENPYGLSGAVFGNEEKAQYVARKMKTGMVIINDGTRTHAAPFGGYKHSGIGREGGRYGFEEYLEIKTIFS